MELSIVLQTVNGKMHEKCLVQAEQILTNFIFFSLKPHIPTALVQDFITSHLHYCYGPRKSLSVSLLFPAPNSKQSHFSSAASCVFLTQISHITPQLKTFAKLPEIELLIIFLSSIVSSFPDHIMSVLVRALLIAGYRYSPNQLKRSGRLLQGCQELLERQ